MGPVYAGGFGVAVVDYVVYVACVVLNLVY